MIIKDSTLIRVDKSDVNNGILIVPNGIKTIGSNVTYNLNIKKIVFPKTVTEIQDNAFSNCGTLEEVNTFSKTLKIGSRVSFNCKNLKNITPF